MPECDSSSHCICGKCSTRCVQRYDSTPSVSITHGRRCVATLKALRERDDGVTLMRAAGQHLHKGLQDHTAAHGLEILQTGPPQLPYLTFAGDPTKQRLRRLPRRALPNGLWLHPAHNWFLSVAHGEGQIEPPLDAAE